MNTKDTKQPPVVGRTLNQGALKLKDACEYLGGISPITVRRLIKRKQLRPNRTLRHILIPVAELDRFLVEGQQ
jgi:excisionase family DNA binding protein